MSLSIIHSDSLDVLVGKFSKKVHGKLPIPSQKITIYFSIFIIDPEENKDKNVWETKKNQ